MTALSFLLVGTPRSGTTLTQRLCCELPGVAMPPETHFLQLAAPRLLARRTFPLRPAEVVEELDDFRGLATSAHLDLDSQRVLDVIGDRCDSLLELFAAIVVALCPAGTYRIYGEKTPEHLLWWRVLARADPLLKIVGVVRDPRAVAASHRAVPWGIRDPAELAEEWAFDQRQLRAAARLLGPARCLLLRYEDVVADPDAARSRLGAFLDSGGAGGPVGGIVQSWEWWKTMALGPVTTERTAAWRAVLTPSDRLAIERVAGREMAAFHYLPAPPDRGVRAGDDVRSRLAARLLRVRARA